MFNGYNFFDYVCSCVCAVGGDGKTACITHNYLLMHVKFQTTNKKKRVGNYHFHFNIARMFTFQKNPIRTKRINKEQKKEPQHCETESNESTIRFISLRPINSHIQPHYHYRRCRRWWLRVFFRIAFLWYWNIFKIKANACYFFAIDIKEWCSFGRTFFSVSLSQIVWWYSTSTKRITQERNISSKKKWNKHWLRNENENGLKFLNEL